MTPEEIIKGNGVIASFMGAEYERKKDPFHDRYIKSYTFRGHPGNWRVEREIRTQQMSHQLMYHTDWDWLMPVWLVVRSVIWQHSNGGYPPGFQKYIEQFKRECFNATILTVYAVVLKSIEWYNSAKETLEKNCTMCGEKEKGEGLSVCQECYDNFDGDRRGFWEDEDY